MAVLYYRAQHFWFAVCMHHKLRILNGEGLTAWSSMVIIDMGVMFAKAPLTCKAQQSSSKLVVKWSIFNWQSVSVRAVGLTYGQGAFAAMENEAHVSEQPQAVNIIRFWCFRLHPHKSCAQRHEIVMHIDPTWSHQCSRFELGTAARFQRCGSNTVTDS